MNAPPVFDPKIISSVASAAAKYDRVALVLQGGGALGAYQAGVYEALADAGTDPNWLSGVSIGGINTALIAGNEPARRIERLREFWNTVSGRSLLTDFFPHSQQFMHSDQFVQMRNMFSAWTTMTLGQPGFFQPRVPNPWLISSNATSETSYYDTSQLRATLEQLIDFDLLNSGAKRISLGAVNVRNGNFIYFDSSKMRIGPEHIMASAALPPALPAVEIDGEFYWDGGIVSNTPLQYLLEQDEDKSSLVFQVDLFSALGKLPHNMADVLGRQKDIIYSSRTRQNTDSYRRVHLLKSQLLEALKRVPAEHLKPGELELIEDYSNPGVVNIIHLIYQSNAFEGDSKDYEFSENSMHEHWNSGYRDTIKTLAHVEWLEPPASSDAIVVHDIHRETDE